MRGVAYSILLVLSLTGCSYSFLEGPSSYPAGTTSGDFPDYNFYASDPISPHRVPTEVAFEVSDLLKDIFQVQNPGEVKCANVGVFKKFVDMFFNTADGNSPQLNYLCLFQADKNNFTLNWQLSDYQNLTWPLIPPYNLIDSDLHVLKSIDVFLDSSLAMTIDPDVVRVQLQGVTFNLDKSILKGTPYSWIPEYFLSFEVDKIEITDDGHYVVKLKLPLNIPLKIKGALELYLKNNALRVMGNNFYMQF